LQTSQRSRTSTYGKSTSRRVRIAPGDYARWLGDEPNPRVPAEPMRMWPVSTRVNTPENDDAALVEPIELAPDAA
jgi:hypothetical protein